MNKILLLVFLLLLNWQANAEKVVWVTDKLYLGLYQKPDDKSKRLKLLVSGAKVTVLDRKGRYNKVKTASGIVGWAKAHLLLKEPTSAIKLKKLKKDFNDLKQKKDELENKLLQQAQMDQLKIQQLENNRNKILQQLEQAKQDIAELETRLKQQAQQQDKIKLPPKAKVIVFDNNFYLLSGSALLALLFIAFYLGRRSFEKKVRGRLHGYKIW